MVLAMGLSIAACAPKAETAATDENGEAAPVEKTADDLKVTKAEIDTVSYLVGVNFGSFIKNYDFGKLNFAQIRKGIDDFVNAKGTPRDADFGEQFKIDPNEMNRIINAFLEKKHELKLLVNKEKEDKFLAANAQKEGVQTTPSGLQYKIISEGNEIKPASIDTVWVLYKGTLLDGTVFDQTEEGAEPVRMILNRVIPGWTEGLQLIGEGGEIELYIPAALAYGERGTQGIEPNSTLIFNVQVDKVGKFVPKEETK